MSFWGFGSVFVKIRGGFGRVGIVSWRVGWNRMEYLGVSTRGFWGIIMGRVGVFIVAIH